MLYDLRVGTSICDVLRRSRYSATASHAAGASGTSISSTLDGRWVTTIVFNNPIRVASGPTPRNDRPATTFAAKNMTARTSGDKPHRRWNQYATSDCTTSPPANASMPNSTESLATVAFDR